MTWELLQLREGDWMMLEKQKCICLRLIVSSLRPSRLRR